MSAKFLLRHRDQFVAMGLPEHLHLVTCEKILSQTFDAGSYVQFLEEVQEDEQEEEQEEEQETVSVQSDGTESCDDNDDHDDDGSGSEGLSSALATKYSIVASEDINSEGMVLLVDHMW